MKGKPIEPGCLAMIVSATAVPENIGRVVVVDHKITYPYKQAGAPQNVKPWLPDTNGVLWFVRVPAGHPPLVCVTGNRFSVWKGFETGVYQKDLIRLDEGEEPKTVSTAHTKDLDQVI